MTILSHVFGLKRMAGVMALATLALVTAAAPSLAGVPGSAGPYKVEIATDPQKIVVGPSKLWVKLTDQAGNPVEGASIRTMVKMPTMDMGEQEAPAQPEAGQPGVYSAPASFMMEGDYEATLTIAGGMGNATAKVPLKTGLDTGTLGGEAAGPSLIARLLPWLLALAVAAFLGYRMKKTGQRVNWRAAMHWQFVAGIAVLVGMWLIASYAIKNWRREGAMTPIEAQAMEMNTPAPHGTAPVELASVTAGPVESTVRYTGQAVGYVEQDVYPRVRGWITWMPFYTGDHVKKGQLLARLDTSEIEPQIAEKRAMANMARQGASVAQTEYRRMLEDVNRMKAEVRGKSAGINDARAAIASARAERQEAEAELAAAETMVVDAEAMLEAAEANNQYWTLQVARTRALQKAGAASGEEVQREQSLASEAAAKQRQAKARLAQAQAEIRAKRSALRRADAMISGANARLAQMAAELEASQAQVRVSQAAADAAQGRIGEASANVAQARASVAATATQRGYSEIRSLVDGVITQRLISPGVLVNPGQAILKVAQITPIRLQANVAEADLAQIRPGTYVSVRGQGGKGQAITAKATSVAPTVDPTSRMGVVEAVVANKDARFLPGEYVVMDISIGRRARALRVPTTALRTGASTSGGILTADSRNFVWVAEPAGETEFTVKAVPVEVGLRSRQTVEILSGLQNGQRVVVAGGQYLKNGDSVSTGASSRTATAPVSEPAAHDHAGM